MSAVDDERTLRRAERLMRCYPRVWRERYGEEFVALLLDEFEERPHSPRRTADVLASGLLARAEQAGLTGEGLTREARLRTGLAMMGCVLAAFLVVGLSVWSQLTVSWQWAPPRSAGTTAAMWLMSAALLAAAALLVLAALPIVRELVGALARGRVRPLLLPLLVTASGAAVLWLGSRHFGVAWPGTGGHPWSARGIVPAAIAKPLWAFSAWISTFWVHPWTALQDEPAETVAWMALSPLALVALLAGLATVIRRLELPAAKLRLPAMLAPALTATMVVFLAGAASWVLGTEAGPANLFRVGMIDDIEVAVMAIALVLAARSSRRALGALDRGSC
jgi:hypothetical protein